MIDKKAAAPIIRAMNNTPFSGGIDVFVPKPGDELDPLTIVAWLADLSKILSADADRAERVEERYDDLKRDVLALRRIFGDKEP